MYDSEFADDWRSEAEYEQYDEYDRMPFGDAIRFEDNLVAADLAAEHEEGCEFCGSPDCGEADLAQELHEEGYGYARTDEGFDDACNHAPDAEDRTGCPNCDDFPF